MLKRQLNRVFLEYPRNPLEKCQKFQEKELDPNCFSPKSFDIYGWNLDAQTRIAIF